MVTVSKNILNQLAFVIKSLSNEEYTSQLEIFSGASIGQHIRHILEFYICLIDNDCNVLNYDLRQRDIRIEENKAFSLETIQQICEALDTIDVDRELVLEAIQSGKNVQVKTSLHRELLYAIEHGVHHMAILKMGLLLNFPSVNITDNFGVAESTIQYRNQCAQ